MQGERITFSVLGMASELAPGNALRRAFRLAIRGQIDAFRRQMVRDSPDGLVTCALCGARSPLLDQHRRLVFAVDHGGGWVGGHCLRRALGVVVA